MTTKRGRPPLDPHDASVGVHLKMTTKTYDAAYQQAQAAQVSVPEWIRQRVQDSIADPDGSRRRPR